MSDLRKWGYYRPLATAIKFLNKRDMIMIILTLAILCELRDIVKKTIFFLKFMIIKFVIFTI